MNRPIKGTRKKQARVVLKNHPVLRMWLKTEALVTEGERDKTAVAR